MQSGSSGTGTRILSGETGRACCCFGADTGKCGLAVSGSNKHAISQTMDHV